jgi:ribose transport system permease protein
VVIKRILSIPESGVVLTTLAVMGLFAVFNPSFLHWDNITILLRAMAYPGIVGAGMALCLISGTIDISVGATAGLAGMIFSMSLVNWGLPLEIAALLSVIVGIIAGALNALVIVNFHLPPFIATISSMYVIRGLANFASRGYTIYPLPVGIADWANARPLGISWAFFIMVALMVLVWFILDGTVYGLCIRATGSDIESARCNEVNVNSIQRSTLIIASVGAAIAGVLVTAVLNCGVPSTGTGWELNAIAACAVGGISLYGYQGSMIGLFFGAFLLQAIQNGLVMIGVSSYFQMVAVGIILLVSILLEVRRRSILNLEKL